MPSVTRLCDQSVIDLDMDPGSLAQGYTFTHCTLLPGQQSRHFHEGVWSWGLGWVGGWQPQLWRNATPFFYLFVFLLLVAPRPST